jgi:hypothetical protein
MCLCEIGPVADGKFDYCSDVMEQEMAFDKTHLASLSGISNTYYRIFEVPTLISYLITKLKLGFF